MTVGIVKKLIVHTLYHNKCAISISGLEILKTDHRIPSFTNSAYYYRCLLMETNTKPSNREPPQNL